VGNRGETNSGIGRVLSPTRSGKKSKGERTESFKVEVNDKKTRQKLEVTERREKGGAAFPGSARRKGGKEIIVFLEKKQWGGIRPIEGGKRKGIR